LTRSRIFIDFRNEFRQQKTSYLRLYINQSNLKDYSRNKNGEKKRERRDLKVWQVPSDISTLCMDPGPHHIT
jgi:hypothetical protein